MTRSNVPLQELCDSLRQDDRAWVRFAVVREAEPRVSVLDAVLGEAPPNWTEILWDYGGVLFAASETTGPTVAEWIERGAVTWKNIEARLSELNEYASVDRHESRWNGRSHEPLRWPSEVWRISRGNNIQPATAELIGPNAPSFMRYEVAVANLLSADYHGWNISGSEYVVRRQDPRLRIDAVRVRPTEIEVEISGKGATGAVVEVVGTTPGQVAALDKATDRVVIPLEHGLPDDPYLLVRTDHDWVDRRALSRGTYVHRAAPDDVLHEVDAATALDVLTVQGEGPTLEFKEELPGESQEAIRKVMKTVGAFANGDGGTVLFGVSDDGNLVGVVAIGRTTAQERLTDLVRAWVDPLPSFAVEVIETKEGGAVIALHVEGGTNPPYGVGTTATATTYYVRRGSTTFAVSPSELGALIRSRSAAR